MVIDPVVADKKAEAELCFFYQSAQGGARYVGIIARRRS